MVRLGLGEGHDAFHRQRQANTGVATSRPRQSGAHPIAAVEVGAAGIEPTQQGHGPVLVGAEHPGGETEAGVVHAGHSLIVGLHGGDADDGPKRLVAHDRHVVGHPGEHGGRKPHATVALQHPASGAHHRSGGHSLVHLGGQHRSVLWSGQRAQKRVGVGGVTKHKPLHLGDIPLHELVEHVGMHVQPFNRTARLTVVVERPFGQ